MTLKTLLNSAVIVGFSVAIFGVLLASFDLLAGGLVSAGIAALIDDVTSP
jgi:hypothetical protein